MPSRLVIVAALALLALLGIGAWLVTPTPALRQGPRIVEIPAHERVLAIAERLQQAEVVRSRVVFVALAWLRGAARTLKAGEYEFPRDASTAQVLDLIQAGRVRQHTVLHPEGATLAELARTLAAERLASPDELLRVARDPVFLRSHGIEGPSVEGYLFPDTYQFVRGMAPQEILGRMIQRMRSKLAPEILAGARSRGLTLHQLLTLASIIEREAVDPGEQRLIAAVFWNRLRRDMPLQADPTVQYATGKERQTLTRADLASDSPYNTYRYPGLPPGPIDSPGLGAIRAAIDPAAVDYLYFVAIDERTHHFSRTIEEHNAAVARYRLARARKTML